MKGEISIATIFSLVVAIVGIFLLFLLFSGKADLGKNMYCNSVYKLKTRIWGHKPGEECLEAETITRAVIQRKEFILNTFKSGSTGIAIDFTSVTTKVISIVIPGNKTIQKAEFDLILAPCIPPIATNNSSSCITSPLHTIEIDIGNDGKVDHTISELNLSNSPIKIGFRKALQEALIACTQRVCEIPIKVQAEGGGILKIRNLDVRFKRYDIRGWVYDEIFKCWNRAGRGAKKGKMLCKELILPEENDLISPITEQNITEMLYANKYCHLLSNNLDDLSGDILNCGDENNLRFLASIFNQQHVLIEYIGNESRIYVS